MALILGIQALPARAGARLPESVLDQVTGGPRTEGAARTGSELEALRGRSTRKARTRSVERSLHQMINQARSGSGMGPLDLGGRSTRKARSHSQKMAAQGRIFHTTCLLCEFRSARRVSENVGFGASIRQVMDAMMVSPGHQANILGADFNEVGVGVIRGGGRVWVTMVFIQ